MSFTRTNAGLTNSPMFNGAHAIIYLEGGPSISSEDLSKGKFNCQSCDIRFWQALFNTYRPGKSYAFKSLGSKTAVRVIADKVAQGAILNSIAVMDRDFDHTSGLKIQHPDVLYTHGYSWENDCWSSHSVYETYASIAGACKIATQPLRIETDLLFDTFEKSIYRAVRLDNVLIQGDSSLFDREKFERYITIAKDKRPSLNMSQVKKTIQDKRSAHPRPLNRTHNFTTNALEDCFGHLYEAYAFRALSYLLHNNSDTTKPAKDYVVAVAVEKFASSFRIVSPRITSHYDASFAALTL